MSRRIAFSRSLICSSCFFLIFSVLQNPNVFSFARLILHSALHGTSRSILSK